MESSLFKKNEYFLMYNNIFVHLNQYSGCRIGLGASMTDY